MLLRTKKYQVGGILYTTKKNDPAIKKYADSLAMYNKSQAALKLVDGLGYEKLSVDSAGYRPGSEYTYMYPQRNNKLKTADGKETPVDLAVNLYQYAEDYAIPIAQQLYKNKGKDENKDILGLPIHKKPVQPVEYKKKKELKKLKEEEKKKELIKKKEPKELEEGGSIPTSIDSANTVQPVIKAPTPVPQSDSTLVQISKEPHVKIVEGGPGATNIFFVDATGKVTPLTPDLLKSNRYKYLEKKTVKYKP